MIEARVGQRFFWASVPPRHWKTFTLRHIVARHIEVWPGEWVAWITYAQQFANKQSRAIRRILRGSNVHLSEEVTRQDEWEILCGPDMEPGGFRAKGVTSGIAGEGFRLIVVDDPFGSREDAQSQTIRDAVYEALEDDIIPRLSPDGALLLVHTRWHQDDAIGRYRAKGWRGINIPALAESAHDPLGRAPGEALLPGWRPRHELERIRDENPAKFASLYQGDPRPTGLSLFANEPSYFRDLPNAPYVVGYGTDLAYTARTSADWSRALQAHRFGRDVYFTGGIGAQTTADQFTPSLKSFTSSPPAACRWYIGGGGEKGVSQFIVREIPRLQAIPATTDKRVRATPLAEAYQAGRVHFPAPGSRYWGPWVDDCLGEMRVFTGVNDAHDDWVDAAAAAYDQAMQGALDLSEGFGGVVGDRWSGSVEARYLDTSSLDPFQADFLAWMNRDDDGDLN